MQRTNHTFKQAAQKENFPQHIVGTFFSINDWKILINDFKHTIKMYIIIYSWACSSVGEMRISINQHTVDVRMEKLIENHMQWCLSPSRVLNDPCSQPYNTHIEVHAQHNIWERKKKRRKGDGITIFMKISFCPSSFFSHLVLLADANFFFSELQCEEGKSGMRTSCNYSN